MWTERIQRDDVSYQGSRPSKHNEYNKGSLLNQYGFGYITKAKDKYKRRMIQVYEERDKPLEERIEFKELQELTKDRKRDKKRRDKKDKKKKKHRRDSSSDSDVSKSDENESKQRNE